MRTKNAMQLKALINNRAKASGVSPQLMLQNYMLERLIDRIARSAWRDSVIVKGGMLIGSLIGVDRRTTKDLDTTVMGFTLTHDKAAEVFGEICAINAGDDLAFELLRTEDIREADEYPGIRVFLRTRYAPLAVPITVDVTTGDRITPAAIAYDYPFVFDEGSARIMAYPLETVLAEKVETVLARNVATTRIRDFYDVFELWRVKGGQVDAETLGAALRATCAKRNSAAAIGGRGDAIAAMRGDDGLARQWVVYASKHSYAQGITFGETLDAVEEVARVAAGTEAWSDITLAGREPERLICSAHSNQAR